MLDLLKDCCNCLSLVKKCLNEHIIYYNFSFLVEKIFWNLSLLFRNLTDISWNSLFFLRPTFFLKSLNNYFFRNAWLEVFSSQISSVNKFVLCGLLTYFLHAAISQVFHGPGYSESRFFWVQFSRVQIQGIDLGLRFSFLLHSPGTGLKNRRLLH